MSSAPWRFRFTSGPGDGGTSDPVITLSKRDYRDRSVHLELLAHAGPPPDWAYDLVTVARAAHLADRRVPRKQEFDQWTRTIELSVQVLAPEVWTAAVRDALGSLLSTLTGNAWQVTVEGGACPPDPTLLTVCGATEVALFSGGLDSTSFAAERAGAREGPLFLVTCGQAQLTSQVGAVRDAVQSGANRRLALQRMPLLPRAGDREMDPSNRSRGLTFVACAVLHAAAQGVSTVSIPENGQVAINPPLTLSRLAACSTRSVHPWVLDRVNWLIEDIGGDVTVRNPLVGHTKGEVCMAAKCAGLSPHDLARTVSCAHPLSAPGQHLISLRSLLPLPDPPLRDAPRSGRRSDALPADAVRHRAGGEGSRPPGDRTVAVPAVRRARRGGRHATARRYQPARLGSRAAPGAARVICDDRALAPGCEPAGARVGPAAVSSPTAGLAGDAVGAKTSGRPPTLYVQCAYEPGRSSMSRDTAEQRATRQSRINLRASARQEQLLKQAAAATDRTMTDFVLESAVVEAERVLADRRWFLISDEQWDQFQHLLEQPARDLPRLRALLAKASPFADED